MAKIERPFDQMMAAFEQRDLSKQMQIVVGVPTSFATAWLIPRLHSFRQNNPDIDLRLDTSGSPIEKLGDSLDMIIFFAEEGVERVEFQPLRPQGAFTVALDGLVDPLDGLRTTLRKTPLLVHRHLPHILDGWMSAAALPPEFELNIDTFDDGRLLIAAAQSGLGLALVLEDMFNFYGNAAGLVRPFGEYVRTPFSYAISAKPSSGSPRAIQRFRAWIVEETRKDSRMTPSLKMLETS